MDRVFFSSVLKGMYSFHASTAAYTDFWNLSYGSTSITLSRRHIWQAFMQESIRTVGCVSDTNLVISPNTSIYEVAREAFTYLGDAGIIRAADGHSCTECAQPYKQFSADAIHHNNPTAILEDNELVLPTIVEASGSSSNSNTTKSLVKMVVVDGIVMGPTVCFQFHEKM